MTGPASISTVLAIILAAVLSFILTGLATWYARRRGLLDHPGERHSHIVPTPRGGGAGLVAAMLLVSLYIGGAVPTDFWVKGIVPGVVVLAVTGWWDDHASLGVRLRFFIQLAVTCWLLWCAFQTGLLQGVVVMTLCAFSIVWLTNLYNFMDGSNGMAGLQGLFVSLVLAFLFHSSGDSQYALYALILAGCCFGFLPWNLGHAKVFMGDVGSLALGFLIAALFLYGVGSGAFSLAVAWLVMLLFVTDSTLTLLRRVIKGERWYNAHRQHLYQRLIAHGWTHSRVAMLYQAINLALVLPGILLSVRLPEMAWAISLALTLVFLVSWYLLIRRLGLPVQVG